MKVGQAPITLVTSQNGLQGMKIGTRGSLYVVGRPAQCMHNVNK